MSGLDATFTLTPRSPLYYGPGNAASNNCGLWCYGADFLPWVGLNFSTLYVNDNFYFDPTTAADPTIDYSQFGNRMKVPFLEIGGDLSGYGTAKQLALIFGFNTEGTTGRVLVYTDAGLISDQLLAPADNQFLLEMDVPSQPFNLYFIHAGGFWLFRGLSGYVV